MSAEALPYTVFILLTEFTVGSLLVLLAADFRRMVIPSFVKLCAAMIAIGAGLALWVSFTLGDAADVNGYPLDASFMQTVRSVLLGLTLMLVAYTLFVLRENRGLSLALGGTAAVVGLVALGLVAWVFRLPTWGYGVVLLSLLVGSLSVGAVSVGMIWGHWYLVTPRLPERPLVHMTLLLLAVLAIQVVVTSVSLALPVREVPASAPELSLGQNPFLWMRIGAGLLFPLVLAWMAWQSSMIRATQSATGLLYIAMGAVIAGEVIARGLLLVTAVPV